MRACPATMITGVPPGNDEPALWSKSSGWPNEVTRVVPVDHITDTQGICPVMVYVAPVAPDPVKGGSGHPVTTGLPLCGKAGAPPMCTRLRVAVGVTCPPWLHVTCDAVVNR